ncbi:MAG TPA: FCD domain-containing protein [Solirubrobacteraceae bacterium]|nr:FCD domain-containing protein [Solirubrobacteraceae bacterium]
MSASATPARVPAYRDALAQEILERCSGPAARPGGRLPTERQLAGELGVTRTMVRHALAVLEAEGRISREVGRGTFVRDARPRPAPGGAPDGASDDFGPADVMAARQVIEPQVLPLVVAWASPRDFEEMRRCVQGGATAGSYEEFEVWDFALHHAIVAASRNPLLVAMYAQVERARKGHLWGNLKRMGDSRERRLAYQADHAQLVDALIARELPRAVELMEAHLDRVETNLLRTEAQP